MSRVCLKSVADMSSLTSRDALASLRVQANGIVQSLGLDANVDHQGCGQPGLPGRLSFCGLSVS